MAASARSASAVDGNAVSRMAMVVVPDGSFSSIRERVPWRWRDDIVPFVDAVAQHLPDRLLRQLRSRPHRWRRRSATGCSAAPARHSRAARCRRQRLPNSPPPGGSSTISKCTLVGVSSRRRCWLRMPVRYAMRRSSGASDDSSRSCREGGGDLRGSGRGGGDAGNVCELSASDLGDGGRSIPHVAAGAARRRCRRRRTSEARAANASAFSAAMDAAAMVANVPTERSRS